MSQNEAKKQFTKMSTKSLINRIAKGGMKVSIAKVAAGILARRIDKNEVPV